MNQSLAVAVETCSRAASVCRDGLLLPAWRPTTDLSTGEMVGRAFVYGISLAYMFLGVSIIADRFMAAIEVITSQEKQISVRDSNGEKQIVMVRIWNETVSNLTLMALGSSAPEILLSIIEVCGNGFEAGELGPNTIVGSAAYNLFCIVGYCILVVPNGEVRRIKHLRVFFVTAAWSVFAYVWLYVIILGTSKGVVDLWEALLTFLFFPITVGTAYIVDKKIFFVNFLEKKVRATRMFKDGENGEQQQGGQLALGDVETGSVKDKDNLSSFDVSFSNNPEIKYFEEHRREYINILRELRIKNPDISIEELQKLAEVEILKRGPKSRAYYRIQATRKLVGTSANIKKKVAEKALIRASESRSLSNIIEEVDTRTTVYFEPAHYTCFENVGTMKVFVRRTGGDLNNTVLVDYKSENGSAQGGSDFEHVEGTLTFYPGETSKEFSIAIIDDDVYEEDEHFYVRLFNLRYQDGQQNVSEETPLNPHLELIAPCIATVMILDDDHGGVFIFAEDKMEVVENCGTANVKVLRTSGARGRVRVPYKTINGTAVGGKDFEVKEDFLVFNNNEIEKFIEIGIVDDEDYQKNEVFYIELGEPIADNQDRAQSQDDSVVDLGKPKLGDKHKITISVKESKVIKGIVDKLLHSGNAASILVGTSSWREQFSEALTISADDDDDDNANGEPKEPKKPSFMDYFIHYVSLFWKVLFAFVPPTEIWGGWACFLVSMFLIGVLTAVIGDLASHFGCSCGLKDSVTAISFVALGTSLPDTFASKVAAINDKYADSSIGNVTGSNAVNVFLGIGLAWSIAAFYHAYHGTVFRVHAGSLAFSVTLFCSFAVVSIIVILLRRSPRVGGELGGPTKYRILSACVLFGLWILYLVISGLESYCHIKGF